MPVGCTTASLGLSVDSLSRVTFNSPQVPVLAIITKDPAGSMVSYFGSGSTQVRGGGRGGGWQPAAGLQAACSSGVA